MRETQVIAHSAGTTHVQGKQATYHDRGEAAANRDTYRGTVSVIIGICSFLAGWLLLAPMIGLWFGLRSRKIEPFARKQAKWGIILNSVLLSFWVFMLLVILAPFVVAPLNP